MGVNDLSVSVADTCGSIDCCDPTNVAPQAIYWSTAQTYTATCTEGFGSSTKTALAGAYFSFVSQADADAVALAAVTSEAEGSLVCCTLNGLLWKIPRTTLTSDKNYCDCGAGSTSTGTLNGNAGTTYNVRLRFRGVAEQKTYTGGTKSGYFYTGGLPASDGYNVYRLTVSSPSQVYYLNAGASGGNICYGLDYYATIPIAAGATVTLYDNSIDNSEITNHAIFNDITSQISTTDDDPAHPILVTQPYDTQINGYPGGQFMQVDVYGITAI